MESNYSYTDILKAIRRTIAETLRFQRFKILLLTIITIGLPLVPFLTTFITTKVIDELVKISNDENINIFTDQLKTLVIIFLIINIIERVFWGIQSYFDKDVQYSIGSFYTLQFLKKASDLDLYHYENSKKNDLIKKARESYSWRPQGFVGKLIWVIPDITKVVVSISIVALFSPLYFLIISLSSLPALFVSIKTSKRVWSIWDGKTEVRRTYDHAANALSDESSLMELRIFGTKDYLFNLVKNLFSDFFGAERKENLKKTLFESITTVIAVIGIFSFWLFCISQVVNDEITVGQMTFYAAASMTYAGSLGNFFRNISRIYEDAQYMVDYYKFLDLKNLLVSGKDRLAQTNHSAPRIEFKNVSFKYPEIDKFALKDFSLVINPGEKIAFVGQNGAGKSTIIKLLCRFYDVTSGQILIDGKDIRDLEVDSWYSQLGVLFQNFVHYNFLPVKKAIGVGDVNKIDDMTEVIKAAKKSGADEFIREFEKQYDQVLSKHFPAGVDLSGGQWQRVALARAFFRDAPILILDEPTSAIDAKGEYEIFQRLFEFAQGKTVIMISHRFSTVRQADKIYVIEKGKIIEQGDHQQLMALSGKYKTAFEMQAKGYQ